MTIPVPTKLTGHGYISHDDVSWAAEDRHRYALSSDTECFIYRRSEPAIARWAVESMRQACRSLLRGELWN